jgi:hypothetical protein
MKFINLKLHTDLFPRKRYTFKRNKMIIYPSKTVYTRGEFVRKGNTSHLVEILFYGQESELTNENVKKKYFDFISFSNFLLQSPTAYYWAMQYDIEKCLKKVSQFEHIEAYIEETKQSIESVKSLYSIDYDDIRSFFPPLPKLKGCDMDFDSIFYRYSVLDQKSKLKNQIKIHGFANNINPMMIKLYDNDNLNKSFVYLLYESVAKIKMKSGKVLKNCRKCGKEIELNVSNHSLIEQYVDSLEYLDSDFKSKIKNVLKKYQGIRGAFFHSGKSLSSKEVFDKREKITTGYISFEKEVKELEGRFGGFLFLQSIMRLILYFELMGTIEIENNH